MVEFYTLENVPLVRLTSELGNLVDVMVESSNNIGVETIVEFVEGHEKLMKFLFTLRAPNQHFLMLQQRLGSKWNIRRIHNTTMTAILLERSD